MKKREINYEKVLHICGLSTRRSTRNASLAKVEVNRQKAEFDELDELDKKKNKKIVETEISEIKSEYI